MVPSPRKHHGGKDHSIYPLTESVIPGIGRNDKASPAFGVELIEELQHFVFGRILKSNTARAQRRVTLTPDQNTRLRILIVTVPLSGDVRHE